MDKKISELDQALQINNDAVFPISQDNGGTDTTYKVSITQISAEIGEDQTFSNLDTTDKTLVGAINEVAQGGGGGGSSTLDGLTDVDIDDQTLSDGQVLKYDSAEDKWINDDVGAGGHTIVADDGTDLAQRANLQFKGAYSEDNSVDDTTEVNVVRNMTRAQFNQLSADEKVGLINISDESLSATEIPMSPSDPDFVADRITALESGKANKSWTYIDTIVDGGTGCDLTGYNEVLLVPYANNNSKYNSFVYPVAEVNGAIITIVGSTTHKWVGSFAVDSNNKLTVTQAAISVWTSCYVRVWAR